MSAETRLPLNDLRDLCDSLRPSRLLLAELIFAAVAAVLSIVFATTLR